MLPYFGCECRNGIKCVTIPEKSYDVEHGDLWHSEEVMSPSIQCLNTTLKEAKNLKSFISESECELTNFKGIRKAKRLEKLELAIQTKQISAYPHLFKHLNALQRVTLCLRWSTKNGENLVTDKLFGFLLNLPKLQKLTVWLDEGSNYYENLLAAIHAKKLPSFHIIVHNRSPRLDVPKSQIDWGQYIDTLYSGQIYPLGGSIMPSNRWPATKTPEKRLCLEKRSKIDDLMKGNTTIKNLEIVDSFSFPKNLDQASGEKFLKLISQMKALENLKADFGQSQVTSNKDYDDFIKKLLKIESLQNLKSFTFSLSQRREDAGKVSAPYGAKMKNFRTLSLKILDRHFDLSCFTKALEDLVSLENFDFDYKE